MSRSIGAVHWFLRCIAEAPIIKEVFPNSFRLMRGRAIQGDCRRYLYRPISFLLLVIIVCLYAWTAPQKVDSELRNILEHDRREVER
ncbi:hypothetical protein [Candidatus Methanoperedens sp. BLZ2]|uniref:hypothetical protein n=1 Tax=Candidatus Methanoperedens sp. BLZ2 TaxID=2035255 RepID=UPI001143B4F3|nr:hypothetical protein [Candidatus Methanoperedens sp. BLZ2]KAB2945283.1 MAG: hypothetical protein F9K14_11655 [Candidatus Methanoperedens sp.]MBZ0175571.1 hypothetical protein [Candidatus Methanoperedens nitroreducens]